MDAGDALTKGAQIAVGFAGLTAVVFVRRGAAVHAWPRADKFRLKLLLTTSLLPLALCLLGLFMLGASLPTASVWRWCSGIAAVLFFAGSLLYSRTFLGMSKRELVYIGLVEGAAFRLPVRAMGPACIGAFLPAQPEPAQVV